MNPSSNSEDSRMSRHESSQNFTSRLFNFSQAKIPWISMLVSVIAQNIVWWVYPLIYSNRLVSGQIQHNPLLLTYSVILSLAIFLTFNHNFAQWFNYIVILIPLLFLYFLYKHFTGQQVMLLSLLPIALLLINVPGLNLKNILGLILYSGIAALVMPVVIFYQQNTFLTQPFLLSLFPLFFSYLYFMSNLFVPKGRNKRLTSLVFGIILLINVLALDWNWWMLLAVLIIIFTWLVLINLNLKQRYQMTFFTVLQTLTIMIIFLQQL